MDDLELLGLKSYLANELFSNKPQKDNKRGIQSASNAARILDELKGTVAGADLYDFMNPNSKVNFNDPRLGENTLGETKFEKPEEVRLRKNAPAETLLHELAHSESYQGPQKYQFGERVYPGYSSVVDDFNALMPETENFQKANYGGTEEAAARLRAAYGLQPAGTKFSDFFSKANYSKQNLKDKLGVSYLPMTSYYLDTLPNGKIESRTIKHPDETTALKTLEHSLFPNKRFLEEYPQSKTEAIISKIRELTQDVKAPIGNLYEKLLNKGK